MEKNEYLPKSKYLWLEHFRKISDRRNNLMFLSVLIVASGLLISDYYLNDYSEGIMLARLLITLGGFGCYIVFKFKIISSEVMVLLYGIPVAFIAAYMLTAKSDITGVIQATSLMIVFGFVLVSLVIITPKGWILLSSTAVVSYTVLILLIGKFPFHIYLENGGTLLLLCYAGFPYVAFIRYRLGRENFKLRAEIEYYANNDILTGCFNRRGGMRLLEQNIDIAVRAKTELSICFIDINGLKEVNDRYGHDAGDVLIRDMADIVRERIRRADTFFRYGGDEFIIIFPGCSMEESNSIMSDIRLCAESRDTRFPVSFSFGLSEYDGTCTAEEIISLADQRMYADKVNRLNT